MTGKNASDRITSLFEGETLYIHDDVEADKLSGWQNKLNTYSKDRKKTLIVVDHEISQQPETTHKQFLEKVLLAVDLTLDDIILLNINDMGGVSYASIAKPLFEAIIIAGVSPAQLNLNTDLEPYKLTSFKSKRLLLIDALEDINNDISKKRHLWDALQKMFKKE